MSDATVADANVGAAQAAQSLRLALEAETYRQRGGPVGFNDDWAFHQCAVEHDLGAPIGPSAPGSKLITVDGRSYGYQPFARDTVVSESSQWYLVESLNALLGGTIPASGLGFEVLKAVYATSDGGQLHPGWAFHQFAVRERLGPPLAKSYSIPVGTQNYDIQVFAGDTLCSPVGQPGNVRRLSQIAPDDPLYTALWIETYKPCQQAYHPESPFQQLAVAARLGTPLSGVYAANNLAGATYQVQVFALDTLYMGADNQIKPMSALPKLTFANTPPELRTTFNFSTAAPPPATNVPPASPPPAAQTANLVRVVQLALAQVGKPYVWGAAGPNSFDCSGLMIWCYKQIGVNKLVHHAASQFAALTSIDRSQIQPGDLIYFKNIGGENGVCHVGMYAGDIPNGAKGAMVHAATPQLGVRIEANIFGSPFWSKYLAGIRRV